MSASDRVQRVSSCELRVVEEAWAFAEAAEECIARHWQQRTAQSSQLFNGRVVLLNHHELCRETFVGRFLATEFRKFLYWRETGTPDETVFDTFGTALILSSEGHVVLGRQRAGNINEGLAYPPGGFIDPRDISADGTIDIDGSIAREIAEETGLDPQALTRLPGYLLTFTGQQISIAATYRCSWPAPDVVARIRAHITADPNPELDDVVVVAAHADLDKLAMPHYARVLLRHVFDRPGS